jgi:hypothetical protein
VAMSELCRGDLKRGKAQRGKDPLFGARFGLRYLWKSAFYVPGWISLGRWNLGTAK